ncbi:hypothetical protein QUA70_12400 [Microcoleus sp. LAD1_D5]|uniref:hypothetical protein n=1 Tax=unclassified Microcoleus TaxID=2642155 RepID=UPI002FD46289
MLFNLNTSNGTNVVEDLRGAMSSTNVAVTSTAAVALAANANRTKYMIQNLGSATVFLKEGAAPVTGATPNYNVSIPSGFLWLENMEDARYTGTVQLVTASGTANCMVSEGALS